MTAYTDAQNAVIYPWLLTKGIDPVATPFFGGAPVTATDEDPDNVENVSTNVEFVDNRIPDIVMQEAGSAINAAGDDADGSVDSNTIMDFYDNGIPGIVFPEAQSAVEEDIQETGEEYPDIDLSELQSAAAEEKDEDDEKAPANKRRKLLDPASSRGWKGWAMTTEPAAESVGKGVPKVGKHNILESKRTKQAKRRSGE